MLYGPWWCDALVDWDWSTLLDGCRGIVAVRIECWSWEVCIGISNRTSSTFARVCSASFRLYRSVVDWSPSAFAGDFRVVVMPSCSWRYACTSWACPLGFGFDVRVSADSFDTVVFTTRSCHPMKAPWASAPGVVVSRPGGVGFSSRTNSGVRGLWSQTRRSSETVGRVLQRWRWS